MAKTNRPSVLKREREAKKAEKAMLKRARRDRAKETSPPDDADGVPTQPDDIPRVD